MAIDFLARESHFGDHLYPTWRALPKSVRGAFYVDPSMLELAAAAGVEALPADSAPGSGPLTVVASYRDLKYVRRADRLVAYSEHGAGQSYVGVNSGSYIGANDRAGVVGVLVPGELAAERHRRTHPTIPAFPVGCPKLDERHLSPRALNDPPVVAVSFHWDCRVCKETRGAHTHYRSALPQIAKRFKVIGHAHPRLLPKLRRNYYDKLGIEVVEDFDEVIERADVYCIDNSSTMYEWASLDRPVVVLNAPWYRRKVEHGLRFWSHADVGPLVWTPGQVVPAIEKAIADPPELAARRREIVEDVYIATDGKAAKRAAEALKQLGREWA